ncbi:MAG TPA: DAK2 domain-containing protein [Syntrophomonadaceae bacterium]|nr:DAK2 domain-containing protein [Syntrophomonadaceae bacterium]
MDLVTIAGKDLLRSIKAGCIKLEHNRDRVDLLNVFPVPDGDTGTNMYLTLLSAVKEGEKNAEQPLGRLIKSISMGSLMGARGNSGVILSQIFRGLARTLEGKDQAQASDLAQALKAGSDTAYEAVMKPVEGTILTVIREVSRACEAQAKQTEDIISMLLEGVRCGNSTLEKTPTMLPILREAGVIDAGGQGLMLFLEGMIEGLVQEKDLALDFRHEHPAIGDREQLTDDLHLEYQYCTELLLKGDNLDSSDIKDHLAPLGDSMLVVGEDSLVKIHIHSNHPGKVLETCLQWGALSDIKINNMLEEAHEHRLNMANGGQVSSSPTRPKKIGVVAVATGDGIARILESLGVDHIVPGGQTMNPSTEDLLQACQGVDAENVIILPNNSNVIMAAQQVGQLSGQRATVLPTHSVVQGISAMVAFEPQGELDQVMAVMGEILQNVKYGEVTHAVRDSNMNGLDIHSGDAIGLVGGVITTTGSGAEIIVEEILKQMVQENSELITIFYGQDTAPEMAGKVAELIKNQYPQCEVELHYGGQPYYTYLISVED